MDLLLQANQESAFQGPVAFVPSTVGPGLRAPPRRMQPPSLPISQPIPSCKLSVASAQSAQQKEAVTPTAVSPAVTPTMPRKDFQAAAAALPEEAAATAVAIAESGEHVKHDLLVWFEILELGKLTLISDFAFSLWYRRG